VKSLVLDCSFELKNNSVAFSSNPIDPQLECQLNKKINMTERNEQVTEVLGNWSFEIPSHLNEFLRNRFNISEDFKNYEQVISLCIWESISLKSIPRKISNFFPYLLTLMIEDFELDHIEPEDLKQFPNLIHFVLQMTKIITLGPDLFQYNPKIEVINFLSANIEYVHKNTFRNLTTLKGFMFNSACFRGSTGILNNFNQYYIDMVYRHCSYNQHVPCFYKMDNRESYSCIVQKYRNIKVYETVEIEGTHETNKNTSDVENIEILSTEPGQSYALPGFFGEKFPNIKVVSTNGNFTELHNYYLRFYRNLEELYMVDNFLKTLSSKTFIYNQKLRIIDLSGNQIVAIGIGTFYNLMNLFYLNLKNNYKIDWKASSSEDLKNFIPVLVKSKAVIHDALYCNYENKLLKYVGRAYQCSGMNMNPLTVEQTNIKPLSEISFAFGDLSALNITNDAITALKIERHFLPTFPAHFYDAFFRLESITVRKSFVKKLPPISFAEFTNLKVIDLSHNLLEQIDTRTFLSVRWLIHLNLENNRLKYLSGELFKNSRFLEYVNMIGNECIDRLILHKSEVKELVEVIARKCQKQIN
jgi:Leucine rich repeat